MDRRVRKAVLPVAGLGTRVLPGAKTTPKNMLNVFDRPILSYVIEEGRAAGIEHFVFIVGRGQGAIEDYFDASPEIETALEAKGKADILAEVRRDLPKPGQMSFVRQMAPLGLGHAVWCARDIIGDEPFAVMLPDMLMAAEPAALAQAVNAHDQVGGNIIVVEPAPEGEAHKYGIVDLESQTGRLNRMRGMVEKPAPGTEPSNLFISGRYVLQPDIFPLLEKQGKGAGGQTRAFIHIQDTVRCVELALAHPPERGDRVKVMNQMTETWRVRDLAQMIARLTDAEVAHLPNPRAEADENDLVVENKCLLDYGLNPIRLEDGLLMEVAEIARAYADRADLSKIPCVSHWNAERAAAATAPGKAVAAE